MMDDSVEQSAQIFQYVRSRVTQNFNETWHSIFLQTSVLAVPLLLIICYLHRVIYFASVPKTELIYDFKPIIEKIKESERAYDVFSDKDDI
jgi:hypothetical protein